MSPPISDETSPKLVPIGIVAPSGNQSCFAEGNAAGQKGRGLTATGELAGRRKGGSITSEKYVSGRASPVGVGSSRSVLNGPSKTKRSCL